MVVVRLCPLKTGSGYFFPCYRLLVRVLSVFNVREQFPQSERKKAREREFGYVPNVCLSKYPKYPSENVEVK